VTDNLSALEQERATHVALWGGIAFVIVPGLIFVVGLIALVMPAPPPISVLNGCYGLPKSPLIRVGPGLITVDDAGIAPISMSVETGKEGYLINTTTGFSFQTDDRGSIHAIKGYPRGELIPAYIRRNQPPSLGLILDGGPVKIPKIACPKG
jgi:hypothetical protein